jgi:hypothetical protein
MAAKNNFSVAATAEPFVAGGMAACVASSFDHVLKSCLVSCIAGLGSHFD